MVYLNPAVLEPEFSLTVSDRGRFELRDSGTGRSVSHGRALELAQLVVENPGRTAVTIHSPGISISGHGKKKHSLVPRMFTTDSSFGANNAIDQTVFRLEPYGRVTFLLDFWSVVPSLLEEAPKGRIFIRGFVGVAGRTTRPQKSSWRKRWLLKRGSYTAIVGSPDFTPFSVIWRSLYVLLPERTKDEDLGNPAAARGITRGMLGAILDEAMSRYDERPTREELSKTIDEIAKLNGDAYPMLGSSLFVAYAALDRMAGHLTSWTEGLSYYGRRKRLELLPEQLDQTSNESEEIQ